MCARKLIFTRFLAEKKCQKTTYTLKRSFTYRSPFLLLWSWYPFKNVPMCNTWNVFRNRGTPKALLQSCIIFTVRNSSYGKVMFSQASVILSTGGEVYTPLDKYPPGRHPRADTPPRQMPPSPRDGLFSGRYTSY